MCLIYFRVSTKLKTYTHECRDILEMGKHIAHAISYFFYVNTVLRNVLVICSNDIPTGYFTDGKDTWKASKSKCRMIGLLDEVQVPDNKRQLVWVDESIEYSPWFEYQKCFRVRPAYIERQQNVTQGVQLEQCLQFCKDYNAIGLQQVNCACLKLSKITNVTVESSCYPKETETCTGDKYAYCANINRSTHAFIIYKKVNISGNFDIGNCLHVTSVQHRRSFHAKSCETKADFVCTRDLVRIYGQHSQSSWMSSDNKCPSAYLVSFTFFNNSGQLVGGNFWLNIIRRPILTQPSGRDPQYCNAVVIENGHRLYRYIRKCEEKLPALCGYLDDISSSNEMQSTISIEFSKENRTNDILMTVLIITAALFVAVIIAVIVLYRRRNSLRSGNQTNIVLSNEVTYAQVNKPTKEKAAVNAGESTRKNTADDTYDHMEHHRLSQNQIPTESNYDTMQSVGNEELENDYDVTSGTDRPRQIIVDDIAEYSHMEGEIVYQEIKDVST